MYKLLRIVPNVSDYNYHCFHRKDFIPFHSFSVHIISSLLTAAAFTEEILNGGGSVHGGAPVCDQRDILSSDLARDKAVILHEPCPLLSAHARVRERENPLL